MIVLLIFIIYFYQDFKLLFTKEFWKNIKKAIKLDNSLFFFAALVIFFLYILDKFSLNIKYQSVLLISLLISSLLLLLWKYQFEENFAYNFALAQFMLHFSSYFKQEERVLPALRKSESYLEPCIENNVLKMIEELEYTQNKKDCFKLISDHYLLMSMVSLMLNHENFGDSHIVEALDALEDEIMAWSFDLRKFKGDVELYIRQIVLVCVLSMLVAIMSQNMLAQTVNIQSALKYQKSIFIFMQVILAIILRAYKIMKVNPIFKEERL